MQGVWSTFPHLRQRKEGADAVDRHDVVAVVHEEGVFPPDRPQHDAVDDHVHRNIARVPPVTAPAASSVKCRGAAEMQSVEHKLDCTLHVDNAGCVHKFVGAMQPAIEELAAHQGLIDQTRPTQAAPNSTLTRQTYKSFL